MSAERNKPPVRLAILISGGGSTMDNIATAAQKGGLLEHKVKPVVVISSRRDAPGIEKARAHGIPVEILHRGDFKGDEGRETFGLLLLALLCKYNPDFVSQNGWLPLTPERVIRKYKNKIVNQHPAYLNPWDIGNDGKPRDFGGIFGLMTSAAVLKFQQLAGREIPHTATIHYVQKEFDTGLVLASDRIPTRSDDSPETLAHRMLPVEHALQIRFWEGVYFNGPIIQRVEPIIQPYEEPLLRQAVIYAREQYPKG